MPDAETTNGDPVDLTPLTDLADGEAWAMVESSPDGMVLADDQGAIVLVNRQIEELFGFERAELLGRPVEELLPESVRARHRAHRTRYRAEPTVRAMGTGIELRARRADGTEFPVEVSLSPIHTANGARVVATVRDITERLAAEANSRTVLRALDTASDAVFVFSTHDLAFVYVNDGAVTQLGYSRDELLTMTPLHIKPDFSNESFREMIRPLAAGEVSGHVFTTLHRRADGEDVPVEIDLELAPTIGPEGPTMLLAIARDISDLSLIHI